MLNLKGVSMCSDFLKVNYFKTSAEQLLKSFTKEDVVKIMFNGFSRLELHAAFNHIKNKKHFVLPIESIILKEDYDLCNAASIFFINKELVVVQKNEKYLKVSYLKK